MPVKRNRTNERSGPKRKIAGSVDEAMMIADAMNPKKYTAPLTDAQRKFAEGIGMFGLTQTAAARAAGYPDHGIGVVCSRMMRMPAVLAHIRKEQDRLAAASTMTKKKVLDGILEAIDMARVQSEPLTMITGWRDIGKMCGFFEPTRHKIELSVQGEVVIQRLQQLDDAKLLQLAEGQLDALDGEFTVLP